MPHIPDENIILNEPNDAERLIDELAQYIANGGSHTTAREAISRQEYENSLRAREIERQNHMPDTALRGDGIPVFSTTHARIMPFTPGVTRRQVYATDGNGEWQIVQEQIIRPGANVPRFNKMNDQGLVTCKNDCGENIHPDKLHSPEDKGRLCAWCPSWFCESCSEDEDVMLVCENDRCALWGCQDCIIHSSAMRTCGDCDRTMCIGHSWFGCSDHSTQRFCSPCSQSNHLSCSGDDNSSTPNKNYTTNKLPEYNTGTDGKIILDRSFGVEIEAYTNKKKLRRAIAQMLPNGCGIGGDGSLKSSAYAFEIQTPPAGGHGGEKLIQTVCKVLAKNEAFVDLSCGLHVHIEGKDLVIADDGSKPVFSQNDEEVYEMVRSASSKGIHISDPGLIQQYKYMDDQLKQWQRKQDAKGNREDIYTKVQNLKYVFATYIAFDDVIRSFLPRSRRDNRYCLPLRVNYRIDEVLQAYTQLDIERIWYRVKSESRIQDMKSGKYNETRYRGINLHSLFTNGTVEIRYHSGTINATKILHWVRLHQSIVGLHFNSKSDLSSFLTKGYNEVDIETKVDMLLGALKLPSETVTYLKGRFHKFERISQKSEEEVDTKVLSESVIAPF